MSAAKDELVPFVRPSALNIEEMPYIVARYQRAARSAEAADFDGVEIHAVLFERFELGCVGAKELAEGIVDLDTHQAKHRRYQHTMVASPTRSGKRKEINPMRSRPRVRGLFAPYAEGSERSLALA